MGIKNLNRFLYENCKNKNSIRNVSLKELSGKTVVIDTSIYLYKFIAENALLKNMKLFVSILKSYNIKPIFIFDGKPPPEKRELLLKRYFEKKEAEQKYLILQNKLLEQIDDLEKNKEMITEMENLKGQFIRISDEDIQKTKELLESFGIVYYDAPSEADELCAHFVKSGEAWACISDDMDMFIYGCSYIVRNINLKYKSAVLYDRQTILADLGMSEKNFCEILVLSGTDYNINSKTSLNETIKWFNEYKKSNYISKKKGLQILEFYEWLYKYTKYIDDYNKLIKTYQMFQNVDSYEVC